MIFSKNNQRNGTEISAERVHPQPARLSWIVRAVAAFCVGITLNLTVSTAKATPAPTSVTLAWDPSPDAAVTGYFVHYGAVSGQYTNSIATGNTTSVTISGLTSGVLYYFAVSAHDSNGVQSPFSNEISYRPPAPAGSQLALQTTPTRQVQLTVWGQSGRSYNIEATQNFQTWSVIGTVTAGADGSVEFVDANAATFPRRFYRLHDPAP